MQEVFETIVLPVLVTGLSAVLLYALAVSVQVRKAVLQRAKTALGAENFRLLQEVVEAAVQAAEQNGLAGKIRDEAQEKFNYALQAAQAWFNQQGIPIETAILADQIEAAVRRGVHKRVEIQTVDWGNALAVDHPVQ